MEVIEWIPMDTIIEMDIKNKKDMKKNFPEKFPEVTLTLMKILYSFPEVDKTCKKIIHKKKRSPERYIFLV